MIEILSWNIQVGLGVDGRHDLARIAREIAAMGDPDVICLQEVCRFMPSLDGAGADQVAELGRLFPGHEPVFGPAFESRREGGGPYRQLGNLIFSRLPVLSVLRHTLPRPAAAGIKHMPRQAVEICVSVGSTPLRVITTHLEYHSPAQRRAQVERLCALQREALENLAAPPLALSEGPYAPIPRPADCVVCGDFNMVVGDSEYQLMLSESSAGEPLYCDAWPTVKGGEPHQETCGIFDSEQWPKGPHCRDFFFVAPQLSRHLCGFEVNRETDASDHQPLSIRLEFS